MPQIKKLRNFNAKGKITQEKMNSFQHLKKVYETKRFCFVTTLFGIPIYSCKGLLQIAHSYCFMIIHMGTDVKIANLVLYTYINYQLELILSASNYITCRLHIINGIPLLFFSP